MIKYIVSRHTRKISRQLFHPNPTKSISLIEPVRSFHYVYCPKVNIGYPLFSAIADECFQQPLRDTERFTPELFLDKHLPYRPGTVADGYQRNSTNEFACARRRTIRCSRATR